MSLLNSFIQSISEILDVKNVEWHCGKAEEILPNLLKRFHDQKVVAIVDPPRAGLRKYFQTSGF